MEESMGIAPVSEMEKKKRPRIDMRLLPMKIHYFLAFGALGGVIPFLPVLAKGLNIHATAVGIIFTIIPFIVLLAKPLFGSISDHFKNLQRVLVAILSCITIIYLLILLIPPIQLDNREAFATVMCQDSSSNTTLSMRYDPSCLLKKLDQGVLCHLDGECSLTGNRTYPSNADQVCNESFNILVALNTTTHVPLAVCRGPNETSSEGDSILLSSVSQNFSNSSTCKCLANNHLKLNCTPSLESCAAHPAEEDLSKVYSTFQFWAFLFLVMIGSSGSAAIFSLSDAACYELLGGRTELYGRQRLFATISWGAIALLAGFLNDLASTSSGESYFPGFCLMVGMAVLDLIILCRVVDLKQSTSTSSIWKDVGSLFSSCRVIAFAMGVLIVGGLSGMLWNYQFWYLQNLGATQFLLGLTITVQCLAAEVPFFFFSGWIIERLGHSLCLILTFVTFALRYFLYYLLTDPWYTLPIEILHGWTFGVFYATMTSYASHYAPPGTEATMQGVLGGIFEGLGLAIGSLLSGVGFDQIGDRNTFLTAAIVSAFCSVAFTIVTLVLKRQGPTR